MFDEYNWKVFEATILKVLKIIEHSSSTLGDTDAASIIESLPQELVSLIASFLERKDDEDFPPPEPAAAKFAVECRTFASIGLKSTELSHRAQTLTGHRRVFISTLSFDVVLPEYSDHRCAKIETEKEMHANNETFTYAMQALFDLLKTWEPETYEQSPSFALAISAISSPMDKGHRPAKKEEEDDLNWAIGKRADLREHRYQHSLIDCWTIRTCQALPSSPVWI